MDSYIREGQESARIQAMLCDRTVVNELGGELSLPDYQPEIKRLLRVCATVSPPDKYIGMGSAELSGMLHYSILYAGNDGGLYCTNQASEYQFSIPVEMNGDFEMGDGLICDVDIVPDMTVGRVAAPRRLSLKCRLRARVRLYGTRVLDEKLIGGDEGTVERLMGQAECARTFVGTGEALRLGDEIVCDGQAENLRVICAEGQVLVMEASAGSGCVNCRGEVALKLLCCRDESEEPPFVQNRRIPFSSSVPVDGAEVNCDCSAEGVCTDVGVTIEEGRILCEVSIRLSARARRNESVSYTRDLYSTTAGCENKYETLQLPYACRCVGGNFSLNTTLSLEEVGIRPDQSLIDVSLVPAVTGLEAEHGKYVLTGRCRALAILRSDKDMGVQEFELPFRYETDGACVEMTDYDAVVTPITCRARADGERIGIDAELGVLIAAQGKNEIRLLREATFGERVEHRGASYTVCYPSHKDTLWSVAKRYHRSVADVARMNPLSGSPSADAADSLEGISYLLV